MALEVMWAWVAISFPLFISRGFWVPEGVAYIFGLSVSSPFRKRGHKYRTYLARMLWGLNGSPGWRPQKSRATERARMASNVEPKRKRPSSLSCISLACLVLAKLGCIF